MAGSQDPILHPRNRKHSKSAPHPKTQCQSFPQSFPSRFNHFRVSRPDKRFLACYTRIGRNQLRNPFAPFIASPAARSRARTPEPMPSLRVRLPISIHLRNPLKKRSLHRHDLQLHIPGTGASPAWGRRLVAALSPYALSRNSKPSRQRTPHRPSGHHQPVQNG